jgi:hypothetical protein
MLKVDHREKMWSGMDCIDFAQDRDQLRGNSEAAEQLAASLGLSSMELGSYVDT